MSISVSQLYPELMHYTRATGLRGILSSGCLWATDAACLNDASEITHFFDVRLKQVIGCVVRQRAIELAQTPAVLARMTKNGGFESWVDSEVNVMVRILKEATLEMNRPFVLSLCGANDPKVAHSGLLSQWRGYGNDGGFAIVFDTSALESALQSEAKQFRYMHVQMGDVYYEGIDPDIQPARADFDELEQIVRAGVAGMLRGGTAEETEGFYQAVTSLSCLCKHWGFWEEREVRVVVVPASPEVLEADTLSEAPPKAINLLSRKALRVPYVKLFGNPAGPRLPIKRVIVGPHSNSSAHIREAEELLRCNGYEAEVVRSEIPYIGR